MAAASRELRVQFTGDTRNLQHAFKTVDHEGAKAEGRFGSLAAGAATAAKGFGVVGAVAGGALAIGLKKSVEAAERSQVSQAKLQAQLKASGISYKAHAKEIDNVIQKTSQLAAIDDEDVQDAFTNLVRSTGNVSQSMKLVGTAADVARAKHIGIAQASMLVGKVANGNVGALKRFGIAFDPVTKAQDRLKASTKNATAEQKAAAKAADKQASATSALGLLQQKVGGQAAAYGKTAAGAQERFHVAVENLQEAVGKKLLPVITKVTNVVSKFVNGLTTGTGAGGRFAKAMKTAADAVKTAWETMVRAVSKFIHDNQSDINALGKTAKNLGTAIRVVFQDVILPVVKRVVKQITPVIEGVLTVIRGVIRVITGVLTGNWRRAWGGLKDILVGQLKIMLGLLKSFASNVWDATTALGKLIVRGIVKGITGLGSAIKNAIIGGVKSAAGAVGGFIQKANPFGDVTDTINNGISAQGVGSPGGATSGLVGGLAPAAQRGLSAVRTLFGPVVVSSGRRSAADNARVGGAPNSDHLTGNAVDLVPVGGWNKTTISLFDRIAAWARHNPAIRWIGWRGVPGHGPGDHLHLSFNPTGRTAGDVVDKLRAYGGKIRGVGDVVGGHYSKSDLAKLWVKAGGRKSAANIAASIALAESGGQSGATHRNSDGSTDRGLWQINSTHGAMSTLVPLANAHAAVSISHGGSDWAPWTTFTSGAYRRFVGAPFTLAGRIKGKAGTGARSGIGTAIQRTGNQDVDGIGIARADLKIAEAQNTPDQHDDVVALLNKKELLRQRLVQIRLALKNRHLRPATRKRLLEEASQIVSDTGTLDQQIGDITIPKPPDDTSTGSAGDTSTGTAAAAQAMQDQTAAWQALQASIDAHKASIDALNKSISDQNKFNTSLVGTQIAQISRGLADMMSGEIVGKGLVPRSALPNSGLIAAY